MNHPKASYEDTQYHLYVLEKVKHGLKFSRRKLTLRDDFETTLPHKVEQL